ncbi:MAG: hypothetical protein GTO02_19200 [Candidatus Dadabacteria bacterium]|nr:hypothetical protein [Candidatus Dadabacteria bacterium]NIQ16437.1 hypothetical protein [Candidatus Dadabacteria bacterium]
MANLEEQLDIEVKTYLKATKQREEVKSLISGEIDSDIYKKFLKTFFLMEFLSQRAVNMASIITEDKNPYLSKRFHSCAQGELGHAEIAMRDYKDMGGEDLDPFNIDIVREYDKFLQDMAENYPLGILGHSYLFENVSGLLFPNYVPSSFPSKFIEVHAKEDPGHSIAIKRTVRNIEDDLEDDDITKIIALSKKSGDYLWQIFEAV